MLEPHIVAVDVTADSEPYNRLNVPNATNTELKLSIKSCGVTVFRGFVATSVMGDSLSTTIE